jgi:hypothetical protein
MLSIRGGIWFGTGSAKFGFVARTILSIEKRLEGLRDYFKVTIEAECERPGARLFHDP